MTAFFICLFYHKIKDDIVAKQGVILYTLFYNFIFEGALVLVPQLSTSYLWNIYYIPFIIKQ